MDAPVQGFFNQHKAIELVMGLQIGSLCSLDFASASSKAVQVSVHKPRSFVTRAISGHLKSDNDISNKEKHHPQPGGVLFSFLHPTWEAPNIS